MEKKKFLSLWILITGIIISIIAVIHNAFAPEMYYYMLNDLVMKDKARGAIYFFVLGGAAFLFAGLLSVFSSFGLKKSEKWSWIIATSSSLFVALARVTALTFAKFDNPLIYVSCSCAISNVVLLFLYFKN